MPTSLLVRLPYMSTLAQRIKEALEDAGKIPADLARANAGPNSCPFERHELRRRRLLGQPRRALHPRRGQHLLPGHGRPVVPDDRRRDALPLNLNVTASST